MSADPTTARERVRRWIDVRTEQGWSDNDRLSVSYESAPLLMSDLRVLAGAPTADVAALPTPEDVAAEMSRRMVGSDTVARRLSLLDPACRALDAVRALQPAAPEGVDAADANRCSACERSLRRCCYTCPRCDRHEDTCEGVDAVDELAEAEDEIRRLIGDGSWVGAVEVDTRHLGAWLAEYDERGRERDAARAEVERLREALRGSEVVRDLADRVNRIGALEAERDALSQLLRRMARRSILFRRLARVAFRQLR